LRPEVATAIRDYLRTNDRSLDDTLFAVPPTIRVFDADLDAAGITKTDPRGRVVDIHALRHTIGTHLSAVGVHPRVAMAAMRHSRIELTMNLYTDPALLDVAGAINALPSFSHLGGPTASVAIPV
jgi:integrase